MGSRKTQTRKFQSDSVVLVYEDVYNSIFCRVFLVLKYKEQIRWKSNTQLRWNFFQKSGFRGGKTCTSTFTHVHCWTPNDGFSRSQHMWMTSRACAIAFKSPRPLPVGRRRPIRRQCLRSLLSVPNRSNFGDSPIALKKERCITQTVTCVIHLLIISFN